jgi:serralysin
MADKQSPQNVNAIRRIHNDYIARTIAMADALRVSIQANPLNAPLAAVDARGRIRGKNVSRLCAKFGILWGQEPCIKVSFLDGTTAQQNQVINAARAWEQAGNLFFMFGNYPDAQIRITFNGKGCWSKLGTVALTVPQGQPTMTLGFSALLDTDIQHEFGHALGFYHEHQQPNCPLQWIEANALRDLQAINGWSVAEVRYNFLDKLDRGFFYSAYDQSSIMHYWVDASWHKGNYSIPSPTGLTITDQAWCRTCYPDTRVRQCLTINDENMTHHPNPNADTLYRFTIAQAGTYTFKLGGGKDRIAAGIFGPADAAAFIASINGGGSVSVCLEPGVYLYKVRSETPPNDELAPVTMTLRAKPNRAKTNRGEFLLWPGGDPIQRAYRISSKDKVEVLVVGVPDDRAQITFGDPETIDQVIYMIPGANSTTLLNPNFNIGKNPIRLSIANGGAWAWSGAFTLRINGVDRITISGSGDDGIFHGFHTLLRMLFIYSG